jgi:hypothetical protein
MAALRREVQLPIKRLESCVVPKYLLNGRSMPFITPFQALLVIIKLISHQVTVKNFLPTSSRVGRHIFKLNERDKCRFDPLARGPPKRKILKQSSLKKMIYKASSPFMLKIDQILSHTAASCRDFVAQGDTRPVGNGAPAAPGGAIAGVKDRFQVDAPKYRADLNPHYAARPSAGSPSTSSEKIWFSQEGSS